jgi:hypothetical protein
VQRLGEAALGLVVVPELLVRDPFEIAELGDPSDRLDGRLQQHVARALQLAQRVLVATLSEQALGQRQPRLGQPLEVLLAAKVRLLGVLHRLRRHRERARLLFALQHRSPAFGRPHPHDATSGSAAVSAGARSRRQCEQRSRHQKWQSCRAS